MAARHEVLCITKVDRQNPHERITHIGGMGADRNRWLVTQQDAIAGIESGKWQFYVRRGQSTVDVIVAKSRFGNKYLKTTADGEVPDNLLSLNQCPR